MSDRSGGGGGEGQRQCRRGATGDVELDAAMALADMAGRAGPAAAAPQAAAHRPVQHAPQHQEVASEHDEEELASTRLSLELGKVGVQSSSCSSSSRAGCAAPGYGARPGRHVVTEGEKEAKRLRRVLANRESARQTILRRQAIRDELARKVADFSSQNESMKKEKETAMQEYLTLKEANKQLKEQVVAKTTKKAPATTTAPAALVQRAEAMPSTASSPATPPRPSFLYTSATAPAAVPVPFAVWGSWPGYEHRNPVVAAPAATPLCMWYYPVTADRRGSPPASCAQPFQEATSGGGERAEQEDADSLTWGSTSSTAGRGRRAPREAAVQ